MKCFYTQSLRTGTILLAILVLTAVAAAQNSPGGTQAGIPSGGTGPSATARTDYTPPVAANQGIGSADRTIGRANQGIGVASPRTLGSANQGIGASRGLFNQSQRNFQRDSAGIPGRSMFSRQAPPQNMGAIIGPPPSGPLPNVQDNVIVAPNAAALSSIQPNGIAPVAARIDGRVTIDDLYRQTQPDGFPRQPDQGFGLLFDDRALHDRETSSLHVRQINPSSIAAHAGLRLGDNVLAIDGRQFSSPQDALAYLDARLAANAETAITVVRDGQQVELKASPAAAAEALGVGAPSVATLGARGTIAPFGVVFDDGVRGMSLVDVAPSSAAAVAGLRPNDRILSIDGQRFTTASDALRYLAGRDADSTLELWVLRDGRSQHLFARRGVPADLQSTAPAALGVTFDDGAINFVPVAGVTPNSPAHEAGLRAGDDILSINGQLMSHYKDVIRYLETRRPGEAIELTIRRDNRPMSLQTRLGSRQEVFTAQERPTTFRRRL